MAENRKPFSIPKDGGLPILDENTSPSNDITFFPEGKSMFYVDGTDWNSNPGLVVTDRVGNTGYQKWAEANSSRQKFKERVGYPPPLEPVYRPNFENYPDDFVIPYYLNNPDGASQYWQGYSSGGGATAHLTIKDKLLEITTTPGQVNNSAWNRCMILGYTLNPKSPRINPTQPFEIILDIEYVPVVSVSSSSADGLQIGLHFQMLTTTTTVDFDGGLMIGGVGSTFVRNTSWLGTTITSQLTSKGWVVGTPLTDFQIRAKNTTPGGSTVIAYNYQNTGWTTLASTTFPTNWYGNNPGAKFGFTVYAPIEDYANDPVKVRSFSVSEDATFIPDWEPDLTTSVGQNSWSSWFDSSKDKWEVKNELSIWDGTVELDLNTKYFVDTTNSSLILVAPPNPKIGDFIEIVDLRQTFDENSCTLVFHGFIDNSIPYSEPFDGDSNLPSLIFNPAIKSETHCKLVYTGSERGWKIVKDL